MTIISYGPYELVDEIMEADYQWQAIGVFRRASDGALFWCTDSGCSCYSPWEDLTEADLTPLRESSWPTFQAAVMEATWAEQGDRIGMLSTASKALNAMAPRVTR